MKNWQVWLKHYYDRKLKIKFIISGSSAAHLFMESNESLLGRIENVYIMPMSFSQFCGFWQVYKQDEKVSEFLKLIPKNSMYAEPAAYYGALRENYLSIEQYKPYINKVLKDYLLFGGYPEYFADSSAALWQKRLVEDIIGQGLYRDIINFYKIKNPEQLERLLYFIAANNGQDFNYKTIADTLKCDSETVSGYLSFLEQAYLIIVMDNYSSNIGKTIRKNRKLYVLDNGIANALLHNFELSAAQEGHLIEASCVRDAKKAAEINFWSLYYWRDEGNEVDIVIDKKIGLLPIEIKYRNDPKVDGLDKFADKFKLGDALRLIVTKDRLLNQNNTISVPFWLVR